MYARIMAGIDDQFATSKVFATALALARQFDAKLAFCHALDQTPLADNTADLLARAAEDWHADLLIVGLSDSRGVGRIFSEGVGVKLAVKAPTSLLLVRHD